MTRERRASASGEQGYSFGDKNENETKERNKQMKDRGASAAVSAAVPATAVASGSVPTITMYMARNFTDIPPQHYKRPRHHASGCREDHPTIHRQRVYTNLREKAAGKRRSREWCWWTRVGGGSATSTRGRRNARPGSGTRRATRAAAAGARGLANPAPAGVVLVEPTSWPPPTDGPWWTTRPTTWSTTTMVRYQRVGLLAQVSCGRSCRRRGGGSRRRRRVRRRRRRLLCRGGCRWRCAPCTSVMRRRKPCRPGAPIAPHSNARPLCR